MENKRERERERERERKEQECCLVCDCKQQAVLSAVLPDNVNSLFRCLSLSLVMQEHQSFPSALCCWHRELRLSDSAPTHTHTHTHTHTRNRELFPPVLLGTWSALVVRHVCTNTPTQMQILICQCSCFSTRKNANESLLFVCQLRVWL